MQCGDFFLANDKRYKLMEQVEIWRKKFEEHQICVILPTYNNATTLARVIDEVYGYTDHILVINDGSTDRTEQIIQERPQIKSIGYQQNKGKGWALRKGLAWASQQGYRYAISLDTDGQHFASDLPGFVNQIGTSPASIVIGSRNMEQISVPEKSSFGMKFSNFWFKLETGISCPDTQSGYRSYPVYLINKMRFFTRKYEFEIEVLVRSAWKGIAIDAIPVKVFYAPGNLRISHFRPFADFTRISLLNTVLVLVAFFYIKPRDFFLRLFKKNNFRQLITDQIFHTGMTDLRKSLSVALGIFMGIVPVWGFQLAIAIILSLVLKLNKPLVILAANISIPPMIPLIILLSYKAGAFWMNGHAVNLHLSDHITYHSAFYHLKQYVYGSISLALCSGVVAGLITWVLLKLIKKKPRVVI
jgi:glycosyltransferase involved in cell wall biosynthesis